MSRYKAFISYRHDAGSSFSEDLEYALKMHGKPAEAEATAKLVETLMGRKPELRFAYIQEHARFVHEIDV
jgi:DNA gyrase/topoisomerase IV subunit B